MAHNINECSPEAESMIVIGQGGFVGERVSEVLQRWCQGYKECPNPRQKSQFMKDSILPDFVANKCVAYKRNGDSRELKRVIDRKQIVARLEKELRNMSSQLPKKRKQDHVSPGTAPPKMLRGASSSTASGDLNTVIQEDLNINGEEELLREYMEDLAQDHNEVIPIQPSTVIETDSGYGSYSDISLTPFQKEREVLNCNDMDIMPPMLGGTTASPSASTILRNISSAVYVSPETIPPTASQHQLELDTSNSTQFPSQHSDKRRRVSSASVDRNTKASLLGQLPSERESLARAASWPGTQASAIGSVASTPQQSTANSSTPQNFINEHTNDIMQAGIATAEQVPVETQPMQGCASLNKELVTLLEDINENTMEHKETAPIINGNETAPGCLETVPQPKILPRNDEDPMKVAENMISPFHPFAMMPNALQGTPTPMAIPWNVPLFGSPLPYFHMPIQAPFSSTVRTPVPPARAVTQFKAAPKKGTKRRKGPSPASFQVLQSTQGTPLLAPRPKVEAACGAASPPPISTDGMALVLQRFTYLEEKANALEQENRDMLKRLLELETNNKKKAKEKNRTLRSADNAGPKVYPV